MDKYKTEEDYIINESLLLYPTKRINKFYLIFPAFESKNYFLYAIGQLISMAGTWLQVVAQGWLVFQLTGSALLVGVVTAASTLPVLLFCLFGGVIVDQFNKKKLLLFTQTISMILAFILGLLTITNNITVIEITILAFLLGCANAIDMPARQTFIMEMVGKEKITSAIALNGAIATISRAIGPGIAGILIALVGIGGAFLINAVSYIAVIVALIFIKPITKVIPKIHLHPIKAITQGLNYAWNHEIIRLMLLIMALVSIFGWSSSAVFPVIIKNTFHKDASGLGYLFAFTGLGSAVASVFISAKGKKFANLSLIFWGIIIFSVSLILFTMTSSFLLALILIFINGIGIIAIMSTANSNIQHFVQEEYRGRAMSMYILAFMGLSPIGNIAIGYGSELFGAPVAIRIGAIIILLSGLSLLFFRKKIEKAYELNQK